MLPLDAFNGHELAKLGTLKRIWIEHVLLLAESEPYGDARIHLESRDVSVVEEEYLPVLELDLRIMSCGQVALEFRRDVRDDGERKRVSVWFPEVDDGRLHVRDDM